MALSKETDVPQRSIVGEFFHSEDSKFRFLIVLDDEAVQKARHREIVTGVLSDEDSGEFGVVYITKNLLAKLQKRRFRVAALWHELGHYHNGDFIEERRINNISEDRKQHILKNEVMDIELRADEFACRRWGKSNLIRYLEESIDERIASNDKNRDLSVRELELCISHIRKYKMK